MRIHNQPLSLLVVGLLATLLARNVDAQNCYSQCPCTPIYRCAPCVTPPVLHKPVCHSAYSQVVPAYSQVVPAYSQVLPTYNFTTIQPTCIAAVPVYGQTTFNQCCAPGIVWSPPIQTMPVIPYGNALDYNSAVIEQTFTSGSAFDDIQPDEEECEAFCEQMYDHNTKEFEQCVCDCLDRIIGRSADEKAPKTPPRGN